MAMLANFGISSLFGMPASTKVEPEALIGAGGSLGNLRSVPVVFQSSSVTSSRQSTPAAPRGVSQTLSHVPGSQPPRIFQTMSHVPGVPLGSNRSSLATLTPLTPQATPRLIQPSVQTRVNASPLQQRPVAIAPAAQTSSSTSLQQRLEQPLTTPPLFQQGAPQAAGAPVAHERSRARLTEPAMLLVPAPGTAPRSLLVENPLPPATHVVPHHVAHVCYEGVPIPLFEADLLQTLPLTTLRAHATHVYKLFGSRLMRPPPASGPMSEALLIEWVTEAHTSSQLAGLKGTAPAVPFVYHRGIPIPLYEKHHLLSLSSEQLRAHACHIYSTIDDISEAVPSDDDLLMDWLLEMHDKHLNHHLDQVLGKALREEKLNALEQLTEMEALDVEEKMQNLDPKNIPDQVLVWAEAKKLEDLKPLSAEDIERVIRDTLKTYGLIATAAALKHELDVEHPTSADDATEKAAPPSMADSVCQQFAEALKVNDEQQVLVENCTEHILNQRARIDKLVAHMHNYRAENDASSAEEMKAQLCLVEQRKQLQELRRDAETHQRRHAQMMADVELNAEEISRAAEAIDMRTRHLEELSSDIETTTARIEEMRQAVENTEMGQAQRIKCLLLQWDASHGAKRMAAETFAHVDSNHDGQIEWENGEICRFVRLIFHYHHVAVPPWPETLWHELYRLCEHSVPASLGIVEALKFARGCLEAALRTLSNE